MADYLVLSQAYHGWHDEFASLHPPAIGIPEHKNIKELPNDYSEEFLKTADAVIIEPIITDFSEARVEWLRKLRELCTKHDVVLIFDETITALRFPGFCVANWSGVRPDIIVFGKALGGGLPISIVGGREDIMNSETYFPNHGEYFVSGSYCGERVGIKAALAVIHALQTKNSIEDLWQSGADFIRKFNDLFSDVKIAGYPTRGVLVGDPMPKALFMQEACKAGLLFGASWFYAFPHIQEKDGVLQTLKDVAMKLRLGNVKLEGELPRSPFAQQMREGKKT
jgi:glutamate-1-semialdehyde aminotransferase